MVYNTPPWHLDIFDTPKQPKSRSTLPHLHIPGFSHFRIPGISGIREWGCLARHSCSYLLCPLWRVLTSANRGAIFQPQHLNTSHNNEISDRRSAFSCASSSVWIESSIISYYDRDPSHSAPPSINSAGGQRISNSKSGDLRKRLSGKRFK